MCQVQLEASHWGYTSGSIVFSVFNDGLGHGTGCTTNKLPERVGEATYTQDSWAATGRGWKFWPTGTS